MKVFLNVDSRFGYRNRIDCLRTAVPQAYSDSVMIVAMSVPCLATSMYIKRSIQRWSAPIQLNFHSTWKT